MASSEIARMELVNFILKGVGVIECFGKGMTVLSKRRKMSVTGTALNQETNVIASKTKEAPAQLQIVLRSMG